MNKLRKMRNEEKRVTAKRKTTEVKDDSIDSENATQPRPSLKNMFSLISSRRQSLVSGERKQTGKRGAGNVNLD